MNRATIVRRTVLIILAVLLLSGCAGSPELESRAPFKDFIDEPVRSVGYSSVVEWRDLGRDHVMLRLNRNRFFAVRLEQPCVMDAREAVGLRLATGAPNRLTTADRVILRGRACRIGEIYPFDYAAWREAIVVDR